MKHILLVDRDDSRRRTRVMMLEKAGYQIDLRDDYVSAEQIDHEAYHDMVVLALGRKDLNEAAAYSERLRKRLPALPVLLVTDTGVFVPDGTLSPSVRSAVPIEVMETIATMLSGSGHIRELRTLQDTEK